MPNIANALKAEMSRVARKELRSETDATKKAVLSQRRQISELKKQLQSLQREFAMLRKQHAAAAPAENAEPPFGLRFRASGFAQHRQRLGLSAREMGLLLEASPLSVYKWERGEARPRAKHLEAIAALRKIGKREAQRRLEQLAAG
jgi:DNA-binding transcriptional regulator YiaG